MAYQAQGKFAPSEPLLRQVLEIQRTRDPDDWQRFLAGSLLGAALAGQRHFTAAGPLLLAGYQGMAARKDRIAAADQHHLHRTQESIRQLYLPGLGQTARTRSREIAPHNFSSFFRHKNHRRQQPSWFPRTRRLWIRWTL